MMTLNRRRFLRLATVSTLAPSLLSQARAQVWPSRPVRIVVGTPPGGASDIPARLIGQFLSERLSQSFIIENRPGAGTNIATEAVVRSAPDGHTLLVVTPANAINATLYDNLNFNFIRDIAPIAGILKTPSVMAVNASFPAKSVPAFIAYARSNPGKINFASAGKGTAPHVTGELFKMMTGIDMVHVPYRGGAAALTDLLAGEVQVYFGATSAAIEFIKTGMLRALAVTTTTRSEALPDTPTLAEFVPGFEASGWLGIGAAKDTPAEITDKLNKEINAALADARIRSRFADLGATALAGSRADFGTLVAAETEKWGKVVRAANIKPQ